MNLKTSKYNEKWCISIQAHISTWQPFSSLHTKSITNFSFFTDSTQKLFISPWILRIIQFSEKNFKLEDNLLVTTSSVLFVFDKFCSIWVYSTLISCHLWIVFQAIKRIPWVYLTWKVQWISFDFLQNSTSLITLLTLLISFFKKITRTIRFLKLSFRTKRYMGI